ncbi:MAG: hypothetical protein AB7Q37_07020 [Pyrinomonadaceae bacterium]
MRFFKLIRNSQALFHGIFLSAVLMMAGCGTGPVNYHFEQITTEFSLNHKLAEPFGIAVRNGQVFVTDGHSGRIFRHSEAGLAEFAAGLDTPSGIAFGPDGSLFVADPGSHSVKRIDAKGMVETIAGSDGARGNADGPVAEARFSAPVGIAVSDDGTIFVADTYNDRVRVIRDGAVRTLAGGSRGFGDGPANSAMFDTPLGIAIWKGDKLLVADSGNRRIRVVEPDGRVWTLIGSGDGDLLDGLPSDASLVSPMAVAVAENGVIIIADGNAIRAFGHRSFPYLETVAGGRRGALDGPPRNARFNRPSGIAVSDGQIFIADSENGLVRSIHGPKSAASGPPVDLPARAFTPVEFRALEPGRWPYDPPDRPREIAGTLGEIRGEIVDQSSEAWFHNGLDIPGAYGETARFIRDERILDPHAAQNFGTLRELVRTATTGYVHIRLGRDVEGRSFNDGRFLFETDGRTGKAAGVRIPRGTRFRAGEPIGTLNAMNHVHLIAGRPGGEMNALDALELPGVSDEIPPVITEVTFYDAFWAPIETKNGDGRIVLRGKTRVSVRAYDRMDGNAERRRLAPYRIGYAFAREVSEFEGPGPWTISFEKMPPHEAVKFVYGPGSMSGATGETIFSFLATNRVDGEDFSEGFLDAAAMEPGNYILRVYAGDRFGNISYKDLNLEVIR